MERGNPNRGQSRIVVDNQPSAERGANYEIQPKIQRLETQPQQSDDQRTIINQPINVSGNLYMSSGDQTFISGDQTNFGATQQNQTGTSSEVGTGNFNLKECQEQLIDYYQREKKVQLLPWDPDHTADMETIFVDLELVKEDVLPAVTKYIPLKRNEDLVTLQTSTGNRVNRILVIGDGGTGKSSLLANIAYKWSLQNTDSPLSKFQLVFFISVREILDKNASLGDVIFSQILEEEGNVSRSGLASYIKSNAKEMLFLIDGLDEDNLGILKTGSTEIAKVLFNKIFKKSCVIVTTRPYKLNELGRNQGDYTKVKLKGFSAENIEHYINKYFESDSNCGADLIKSLKTCPRLWHLAATPILLLFLCLLWNDPLPAKKSLPDTETKLYHEVIENSFWKRYHYEKTGISVEKLDSEKLKIELEEFLISLGQVALVGIADEPDNDGKVLFSDRDFDEDVLNLALRVGIMSKRMVRFKVTTKQSVEFLHTSLQDFCAAVYVANLEKTNRLEFEKYVGTLLAAADTSDMGLAIRKYEVIGFCCGHRPEIINFVVKKYIHSETSYLQNEKAEHSYLSDMNDRKYLDIGFPVNLAFEGQLTYKECASLVTNFQDTSFPIGICWTSPYCIPHVRYHLDLLKPITERNTNHFFSVLHCISITRPIEFPQQLPLIHEMLKHTTNIRYLVITFKVSSLDLEELFQVLSYLKCLYYLSLINTWQIVEIPNPLNRLQSWGSDNLEYLNLEGLNFTGEAMAKFVSFIKSSLNGLGITSGLGQSHVTHVMKILQKIPQLSGIALVDVKVGDNVKHLKSKVSQLTLLVLEGAQLTIWALHELASFLQEAKNLIRLDLSRNYLREAINELSHQFKHMTNLKALGLNATGLTDDDVNALREGIKEVPSLCKLHLAFNPGIGPDGMEALSSLKQLPHFKELDLIF